MKNNRKYRVKRLSKESIEAEEIFLDSKKLKESPESEREKLEFPISKSKVYFIYSLIIVLLVVLFGRTFNLQIINGKYWRNVAEDNRIRSYPIKSVRGIIYDKNGVALVSNEPRFDLMVVPADLSKQNNLSEILEYLEEILNEPKENIETVLNENCSLAIPIVLKENIDKETTLILKSKFTNNPAIWIETSYYRSYINGLYFSHLLGYLGKINKSEHEKYSGYLVDDWIGKTGIEFYYENYLRGIYGKKLIEVDSNGNIKNTLNSYASEPGESLILAIDNELQKKTYDTIKRILSTIKSDRAAAVALNPNNGKVLALVSFPSFDNNKFIQGLSYDEYQKIEQNPSKPFLNRTIAGAYPPGSTIKPIIGAAAVKEKIISPNQTINCTGSITISNKYYPNIVNVYHDWKTHGYTNLTKAIAESCNVYFYTIGGGYGDIEGLGIKKINEYLKLFGFGDLSGIDLPGEVRGFIPTENWKQTVKGERWYVGDTYNVSIGQGDFTVSPLQVASAISAIANGGTLYEPQIVEKIGDKLILPKTIRKNIIDSEIIDIIKQGMRETVIYGSARSLYELPVEVAGKTGTAQTSGDGTPHSWFVSFAPYGNPEIVLVILIENGGEGSAAASPAAREILRWYFSR